MPGSRLLRGVLKVARAAFMLLAALGFGSALLDAKHGRVMIVLGAVCLALALVVHAACVRLQRAVVSKRRSELLVGESTEVHFL